MTKILIGVDGSERSEDAVSFGRALALAADAPVVLALAQRSEPLRPAAEAHEKVLREEAERTLARFALWLDDVRDVTLRPLVATTSPAHTLQAAAEQEQAGIIVVGSSHTGRLGRVLPGSTAERPVARRVLSGRGRAARLSKPRDNRGAGDRLRLPADCGRRGRARRRRRTRPQMSASLRVMQVIEPLARFTTAARCR